MRARALAGTLVVGWALALGLTACGSDFAAAPGAADATSGEDATSDAAADVGDAPSGDAPGLPSEGSAQGDGGADASPSDAQEEKPAALCCLTPAGVNSCPPAPTSYPCDGLKAVCATDGGFIRDPAGGTAHCWCGWGDSGSFEQTCTGQGCCGGTVVDCD